MGYDINGAKMAPGQSLRRTHTNCKTPYKSCDYNGVAFGIQLFKCGIGEKVDDVSYVDSSRYESETPLQEAERKLTEYREMMLATERRVARLKKEARFGVQPTNGSMLKIEKRFGDFPSRKAYLYGAIRIGDLWYMTCSEGYQRSPLTWEQLKDFIGDGKFWTPRNYEQAPAA